MVNEIILAGSQVSATTIVAWVAWRVLAEVKSTNAELKKLIALLITPVNLMFEDARVGKVALTPKGEELASLLEMEKRLALRPKCQICGGETNDEGLCIKAIKENAHIPTT